VFNVSADRASDTIESVWMTHKIRVKMFGGKYSRVPMINVHENPLDESVEEVAADRRTKLRET